MVYLILSQVIYIFSTKNPVHAAQGKRFPFVPAAQHPFVDDSSAHILRGPRISLFGIRQILRRGSLSLPRQLPDRSGTDGLRDLSRGYP
ncbi:MAG: hypothetical protein IKA16_00200 [Oscillospiraceae bacterium]|nr:hypothetical protein [Oscillospiraceae bacterium]